MRAIRKFYLGVVVGVGVVYFCLLLILFLSESGYGDLVPVVSFIASEGVPFFLLGLQRRKNWYYFADCGVESEALAGNIHFFHSYECCARQYWRS